MSSPMASIRIRDVSRSGHELSHAVVDGLESSATVHEVLSARIQAEVAAYNAAPGQVYVGMVQPEDAVRYSDGFRMPQPRPLDADRLIQALEEAVDAGAVVFRVGERTITDLHEPLHLDVDDELTTVMQRPVVARSPA